MKKSCVRENVTCIDLYELFSKSGNTIKSLYDISDATGTHISVKGTQAFRIDLFYIKSCQYSMFYTNCS